jgi:hypothetical protein
MSNLNSADYKQAFPGGAQGSGNFNSNDFPVLGGVNQVNGGQQ